MNANNPALDCAVEMMIESYKGGGKLLVCGNGGSAADSAHIVGELVKGFCKKRPLPETLQKAIGTDTLGCMQSGCVLGSALLLDGMIDRMESELGCRATVVATGGIAPVIAPACRHEMHMAADLILRGLAVLYEQNK